MERTNWGLRGACAAIVAMLWPTCAHGAFSFTSIVESPSPTGYPAYYEATINNSNVVAFKSVPSDGATIIYKGSGGPLTPIYSESTFEDTVGACINNNGVVAFVTRFTTPP